MKKILILCLFLFACDEEVQDTTAPTVTITSPVNESTLSAQTIVRADITDAGNISSVIFLVDGIESFSDTASPYEYDWDVCALEDATHTLLVKATDEAGNTGQSDLFTFAIDAEYDCAEECGGVLVNDCAGACNGSAMEDECGNCDGEELEYVELWGECYNIEETTSLEPSNSQTSGEAIPSEIGQLTNLTSLSLGYNNLAGEIPSDIGSLINLTYLRLDYNQLTGSIPSDIGNLTNLTEWHLEGNQLTGDIPQEVCELIESNNLQIGSILSGNNLNNTCE